MNLSGLLPYVTGSGGALVVLALGAWLLIAGKLHSDAEFQRVLTENEQLKSALGSERRASNELAMTGNVTNKLIGALVDVVTDRKTLPPSPGQGLTFTRDLEGL